jgi:hypothetical protein
MISVEGTGKSQQKPDHKRKADVPVLSYCSLLRKPAGVPEHCDEGEINF